MTKPNAQETLTPERVKWFAEYYKKHPEWGIFHVSLADGNYQLGAATDFSIWLSNESEAELREVAAWFNRLSPSQRRRLQMRAEDQANTIVRSA